jgi:hypothetical protein
MAPAPALVAAMDWGLAAERSADYTSSLRCGGPEHRRNLPPLWVIGIRLPTGGRIRAGLAFARETRALTQKNSVLIDENLAIESAYDVAFL